jgi:hypothetical protein
VPQGNRSTRVKAFTGPAERGPVVDVDEWRVEPAVDDSAIVVTLTSAQGQERFYRFSASDAEDITAVLSRLVAGQPGPQGASKPVS